MLAQWVETRRFSDTRLRPGYDQQEVFAFLNAIRDTFLGVREPALTPDEIRVKQFSTTRLRPGYDEEEVDAFLAEAESMLAAQLSTGRVAPAAGPESGVADAVAEPVQIRCLECGADRAAGDQVCARCGAPIAHHVPISADPAEDETGEPITQLPVESLHQIAGQRAGPGSRRNAWIMAGLGLVVLVAVTVLVASVAMIITRSTSSRPSASSAATTRSGSPASPAPTDWASEDQLQSGDCLNGDLGLGTDNPWPDSFAVVPCAQQHVGEVFFAGNAWLQSMAYPGDNKVDNQAQARCDAAFLKYDGMDSAFSVFSYDYLIPDDTTWPSGDRFLVCVAYAPNSQDSGAIPLGYSIEGSDH